MMLFDLFLICNVIQREKRRGDVMHDIRCVGVFRGLCADVCDKQSLLL